MQQVEKLTWNIPRKKPLHNATYRRWSMVSSKRSPLQSSFVWWPSFRFYVSSARTIVILLRISAWLSDRTSQHTTIQWPANLIQGSFALKNQAKTTAKLLLSSQTENELPLSGIQQNFFWLRRCKCQVKPNWHNSYKYCQPIPENHEVSTQSLLVSQSILKTCTSDATLRYGKRVVRSIVGSFTPCNANSEHGSLNFTVIYCPKLMLKLCNGVFNYRELISPVSWTDLCTPAQIIYAKFSVNRCLCRTTAGCQMVVKTNILHDQPGHTGTLTKWYWRTAYVQPKIGGPACG